MKVALQTPAFVLAVLLAGCGKPPQVQEPPLPTVTVSSPAQESVADYLDLTGTVAPSRTVDLVARVSGYLRSAPFEEGSLVTNNQLLFLIEPEPYEQQLTNAVAAHRRAQSEYDRQRELMKENATSLANVERWQSECDQTAAQLELAKINLGYTRVTAPFSGRIGRRFVDPGNLVGPSVNTKLATLDQITPAYVNFNLNERDALRIGTLTRQRGEEPRPKPGTVPVRLGLQNEEGYPHEGTLDFIDTSFSGSSGAVLLRATVQNTNQAVLTGLFVRVRVPLGEPRPMLVVPNSAIGNDQEGDYVLVVEAGDRVARRAVVRGPLTRTGCAIRSGLNASDRVIINGQMKARPGAKVVPVEAAPAGPASAKPAV